MESKDSDERSSFASPTNTEGTYYQSQLGPKAKRAHFFSPLDQAYADACHRDAETVEFTEEEEKKVRRKIDITVLSLIIFSYALSSLASIVPYIVLDIYVSFNPALSPTTHVGARQPDQSINLVRNALLLHASTDMDLPDRTNIGNAHTLAPFNKHFGMYAICLIALNPALNHTFCSTDNNKWTLALSIFYVGYCLLEIPANILQRYIGANRFFFLALNFWGIASLSVVYAKGYPALLVLRVLMGIGEAGYYAGMIYYLSFWYKKHELALRISFCMTGTLPGAIGGLLAFGLVRAKTSLLDGWQFLFLIEAIPTIIMAFAILFFLPSFPFSATFLTPRERAIAQARLNRDQKPTSHGGMNGWQGLKAIVADLNAWLFMLIYVSFNIGTATVSYFLPTLIKNLGYTAINAQGMTVAPYAAGWFAVVFQAWHSDKTRDRGYHVMVSTITSFVGYIILATSVQKSTGAAYFALFLVVGANYSLFPLVMSWAANTFSPTSKRGVGTAFIVSISNCVSIAAPQIYFDPKDQFRKGHAIAAGMLALATISAFTLRTRLAYLNRRNEKILAERGDSEKQEMEESGTEIPDSDPRYKFMT
ncbi:MFS general substrate transporter [Mycena indigotica]|uniref:MFS general substrate transporter n=1 Tax=Mycena indigotica TaxID=2126181 RepID=A0A8H6S6P8_9AGAR|nr:MFS general substrate transporter [Mycena indigotica]KAF7292812.1 MFS general substrate transporter [Mycena indigotica]